MVNGILYGKCCLAHVPQLICVNEPLETIELEDGTALGRVIEKECTVTDLVSRQCNREILTTSLLVISNLRSWLVSNSEHGDDADL